MKARRRWYALAAAPWALALSAATCWWMTGSGPEPSPAGGPPADHPVAGARRLPPAGSGAPAPLPLPPAATAGATGEAHSLAMSGLVDRAKSGASIAPGDIRSLLTFISSPKPGDLTDGEWEERVNGVLNLLRRQTEDGGRQVSSGGSAVPGLTEALLEMAEKNGSKVLRLYAMQHLSLWFAREGAPDKRRAVVDLLERLAERPGEETAGCAVLMLSDIRRRDSAGPVPSPGADGLGAAGQRPPAGDGIDPGRMDAVLESAGRRLAGDAGAGPDVRISAIHACVDRGDAGVLPELRRIAVDASLPSTLRKAAIHAIGRLGTAEDAALLDSLPSDDPNLSQAVLPARESLSGTNTAPAGEDSGSFMSIDPDNPPAE